MIPRELDALLTRFSLEEAGSSLAAENDWNFAASLDEWFSPIQAKVGPDGALWFVDWYNIVIQHNPTPEEFESVGLKIERVIPPGKTAEFTVKPLRANRNYKFFGEFHPETAQGQLVVKTEAATK